jgi:hypothetical protein
LKVLRDLLGTGVLLGTVIACTGPDGVESTPPGAHTHIRASAHLAAGAQGHGPSDASVAPLADASVEPMDAATRVGDATTTAPTVDAALDAGAPLPVTKVLSLSHAFAPVTVAPGDDVLDLCQSWTLGNDEELWVARVDEQNGHGFHHSNWVALPEGTVSVPEGTWNCQQGGYDPMVAAVVGTAFFNASTQASSETLEFVDGAAFRVAPHSMIVGQIHLLNTSDTPIETGLSFDVYTIPKERVTSPLHSFFMNIWQIALPPASVSELSLDCVFPTTDFRIHYVTPHYHALGRELRLEAVGGPKDGQTVFDGTKYGEAMGAKLEPPFDARGSKSLRMTCRYENDGASTVGWGFGGGEMCTLFGFVDGATRLSADDVGTAPPTPVSDDGVLEFENPCHVQAL